MNINKQLSQHWNFISQTRATFDPTYTSMRVGKFWPWGSNEAAKSADSRLTNSFRSCSTRYTKNLVEEVNNGESNVIIMCWAASQSSVFHAHEGSRCFVKVLAGQLREQQVLCPDGMNESKTMRISCDKVLNANDVTYIDDQIGLHKVSNLSTTQPAITLHIYMPAYKKCRIFDTDSNLALSKSKSIEVNFNSIHGEPIN